MSVRWGMCAEPVTLFDFAKDAQGWRVVRDATLLDKRPGLTAELHGVDPWFEGPDVDIPSADTARKLRVTVDATCSANGPGPGRWELFYAAQGKHFSAQQMACLLPDAEVKGRLFAMVPVLSPKMRFRVDPPNTSGTATLYAIRAVPMSPLAELTFEKPTPVAADPKAVRITSGAITIEHSRDRWNAMTLFVDGKKMAETNPSEYLMYHDGTKAVKVSLAEAQVEVKEAPWGKGSFSFFITVRDEGGAMWSLLREFIGSQVINSVWVSETREVLHLPWLTLFSGVGTFGGRKSQALVPGVEYLDDEPSSNEKEIRGSAANRRMVDDYKLCYPMTALAADGRWFSMRWTRWYPQVSLLFDSPDRVFNSGGHVMGLWSPAVGVAREENAFALYGGLTLEAGRHYNFTVTLDGGTGDTIAESLAYCIQLRSNVPAVMQLKPDFDETVRLLAAGWLDSKGRVGTQFRHAVWGGSFPAQPAQDPPAYMLWLAGQTKDEALKKRLKETAQEFIATYPKDATGVDGVSHVRQPTGAFLYGNLDLLVQRAAPKAKQLAERLADGTATYRPAKDKPDYGSTLGATHCNGFTAISAEEMLSNATLTGNEEAIRAALAVLDKMTEHYAGTVPRGAQPWEMPLHTPDILASARLIRCYVLGYLLSGNKAYLEQAHYWAWTGMAMVYLTPPVEGKVGLYATIGVIGATNWEAPNWVGQPVQWCGLVYRSALNDLARIGDHIDCHLWEEVACGITMAGVQMCFPLDDPQGRCGLLPDFYLLKEQVSDGPAINPGTLQAGLAEAFRKTPLYTVMRIEDGSLFHLPGEAETRISLMERSSKMWPPIPPNTVILHVTTWVEGEYRALLTRVTRPPSSVKWNGKPIEGRFLADANALIVTLNGNGELEITR